MGYSKEVQDAVRDIFSQRRQRARYLGEQRRQQLYADVPQLEQIEREMTLTGAATAKAMLSQGADYSAALDSLAARMTELEQIKRDILNACDLSEDYLRIPYSCPKCEDGGYIDGRPCDCMLAELRGEAFRRLNEQSPLQLSGFEQFKLEYYPDHPEPTNKIIPRDKMTEIYNYCCRYAATFSPRSPSIILMGSPGLGKTHLSLAIAAQVIEKGLGVIYGSAQNLLRAVEKEHFTRGGQFGALDSLLDCDLLILDDLGTEFASSFTISAVYNIVNSRLLSARPTIISTNLTPTQIRDTYGEKVLSRLLGDKNYNVLRFMGGDIRQLLKNAQQ